MLIPDLSLKCDITLYKELMEQGLSMGFMMSIVSVGTLILQKPINSFGYLTIAGHLAARKISTFAIMPFSTISHSLSIFISHNKGAKQYERIKLGVNYCNFLALILGIISCVIIFLLSDTLITYVSGSSEIEILYSSTIYLKTNAPFYIILGILLNLRQALQGIGRKVVPLFSSITECITKIIFVIFIIPKLNYLGVVICEPIIWCITCIQLAYYFYNDTEMRGVLNYDYK